MSEETTIRRGARNARYTTVPNHVFEDVRLSMEARWLLGYLLSKPDNWTVRMGDIRKKGSCGRDKARAMISELVDAGYIEREEARKDGKFNGLDLVIYDEPTGMRTATEPGAETGVASLPQTEKPATVEPATVNPPLVKTDGLATPESEVERERGREDDRKKVERAFERAWQAWPTSTTDSRPDAVKAWMGLTPDERALATAEAGRFVAALRANGRGKIISHAVYLREKRWTQLPPPEPEKPIALEAKAFGKLWQVHRMLLLLAGPTAPEPTLTAFERTMVADGTWTEQALRLEKRAKSGFPAVNALHERTRFFGRGVTVAPGLEPLAEAMEAVRVGGERFAEWQVEHQLRGWPWPEFGNAEWVYFPAGGPARLSDFEDAVRGKHHDGDQQAAE